MKITIPVFFYKEEDAMLNELGIETNIEDSHIRYVTFYNINYVSTYIDVDKEYGVIGVNNSEFISPWSKEYIEELIDEQLWK